MLAGVLSRSESTHPTTTVGPVFANTFSSPQDFFQGIYQADRSTPQLVGIIRAVVVPHHLVANASIAEGIRELATVHPRRIILISPDHFNACPRLLCTTDGTFATFFGTVSTSTRLATGFLTQPFISVDPPMFVREHGIYTILPFIAHDLPRTTVIPIAVSVKHVWSVTEEQQVVKAIGDLLTPDSALVVSSDFSHYLPVSEADGMDEKTVSALREKNYSAIRGLHNADQSDCPQCLLLLARLADQQKFYRFQVLEHTNSARLLNDLSVRSTTSHYSMAWMREL